MSTRLTKEFKAVPEMGNCAQRPRLAAVLAFGKRRARQLKPNRITDLEDNTIMKSIPVAPYKC